MEQTSFFVDPHRYEGREGADGRIAAEMACYDLLDALGISYTRADHDHADTIEDCRAVEAVLGWPVCKNLFLCNRQKTQFYLLMLEGGKVFKTKDLSRQLGVSRLSFADAADMVELLGVHPGSVTVLGLRSDREHRVRLVMDRPIYEASRVACHPCISTSTVCFSREALLEKLLPALEHSPTVVDLPEGDIAERNVQE